MKKKGLIYIVLSFAIIFIHCLSAVASETGAQPAITIDYDNSVVTVSGNYNGSGDVFLEIVRSGIDIKKLDTLDADVQMTMFSHVEQLAVTDNMYSTSYLHIGESGTYTVLVKGNSFDKPVTAQFVIVGKQQVQDSLVKVNELISAQNKEGLSQYMSLDFVDFLLSVPFYDNLSVDGKACVTASLLSSGGFDTMNDVIAAVTANSVVQKIYEADTSAESIDIMLSYAQALKLDSLPEYQFIRNEDVAFKENLIARIKSARCTDCKDFIKAFQSAMCLTGLKEADNYGLVKGILRRTSDAGLIDISEYLAMSKTAEVDKKLAGADFTTLNALEEAVRKYSSSKSPVSGGGTASSGKGSGSVNSGLSVDYFANDISSEEKEEVLFSDLTNTHWAYYSILCLKKVGCIDGYENGSFQPDGLITRSEFLKIVLSAFEISDETAVSSFRDVASDDWCYSWIAAAQKYKIVSGDENGCFNGKNNITRQEAAKILCGILDLKSNNLPSEREYLGFDDQDDIAEYALDSIKTLYSAGVINGRENNMFMPSAMTTRAEAAELIFSMLKKL